MRKQFRRDVVQLTQLFKAFKAEEDFIFSDEAEKAYCEYWNFLDFLCDKYGCSRRAIAGAINY